VSEARKGGGTLFGTAVKSVCSMTGMFGPSLSRTPLTIINRSDVQAVTSGVRGNNQHSVESKAVAYDTFIQALHAGEVCIVNRAPPYVLKH